MSATETRVQRTTSATTERRPARPELWNVVLLDDDDHTYEYVIRMLCAVCGHSTERAFKAAFRVDTRGRVVVYTAHRELAELKLEQIKGFGRDPHVASSNRSMFAILEPAQEPEPCDP